MRERAFIAVIGGRTASEEMLRTAEDVGRYIAQAGGVLVCGGLEGVMEYASKGAKAAGGPTIGIIPQGERGHENRYIDFAIATGMGTGRNVIIARTADVLIAVGGEYGTLSEIAHALQMNKPVIGIKTWDIRGIEVAADAEEAVNKAYDALG